MAAIQLNNSQIDAREEVPGSKVVTSLLVDNLDAIVKNNPGFVPDLTPTVSIAGRFHYTLGLKTETGLSKISTHTFGKIADAEAYLEGTAIATNQVYPIEGETRTSFNAVNCVMVNLKELPATVFTVAGLPIPRYQFIFMLDQGARVQYANSAIFEAAVDTDPVTFNKSAAASFFATLTPLANFIDVEGTGMNFINPAFVTRSFLKKYNSYKLVATNDAGETFKAGWNKYKVVLEANIANKKIGIASVIFETLPIAPTGTFTEQDVIDAANLATSTSFGLADAKMTEVGALL